MHISTSFHPNLNQYLSSLFEIRGNQNVFVLIDESVLRQRKDLVSLGRATSLMTIEGGEKLKCIANVERVSSWLLDSRAERGAVLIVVGGGTLLDLGGFVASIFKRGMRLIYIPTTLLAMVDAAIGGKTGINLGGAKNMLGSFYPAEEIVTDEKFLLSLSDKEIKSGITEMLKHAFISGGSDWEIFCAQMVPGTLPSNDLITASARIKAEITSKDERESSLRMVLNFGHTIGHALEAYCISESIQTTHGACVSNGMAVEIVFSELSGIASETLRNELLGALNHLDLFSSFELPEFSKIEPYIVNDKKIKSGKVMIPCFSKAGSYHILQSDQMFILKQSYDIWLGIRGSK